MVVYTCNSRIWKSRVHGQPQLHKTKAKLGHLSAYVEINKASEMAEQISPQFQTGQSALHSPNPHETPKLFSDLYMHTHIYTYTYQKNGFLNLIIRKKIISKINEHRTKGFSSMGECLPIACVRPYIQSKNLMLAKTKITIMNRV